MKRALNEEEKGTLKFARALEPLLRSEGWHYLAQIYQKHLDQHVAAILSPSNDIPGIFAGERDKGAAKAIQMMLNLPKTVVEEAAAIRKNLGEDPDVDD